MKQPAIQIIKDEHLAISAVVYSLRYLVKQMRDQGAQPNFTLLKALLDYIVSYPDRWHHPKEDKFLFAAVKRRTHDADALIEDLEHEHERCNTLIEELKRDLVAFQAGGADARTAFFAAVDNYTTFEWEHMRKEEDLFLPIAERVLTDDDWREIHAAFRENDNPLFGIKPKDEAEALYQRILSLAPEPLGYGKAA
jgi:hemerythrin-like domain-containing protein